MNEDTDKIVYEVPSFLLITDNAFCGSRPSQGGGGGGGVVSDTYDGSEDENDGV